MIKQNPYTQRAIKRNIKAALAAGLTVTGVLPDGTVVTAERAPQPTTVAVKTLTPEQKPRDAREKLLN